MMGYKPTIRFGRVGLNNHPDSLIGRDPARTGQSTLSRRRAISWAIHLCLFLVYAGGFTYAVQDMIRHRHEAGLIHSPARSAVEYEVRTVDESIPTVFAGPPSQKTDAAWTALLKYDHYMVQKEDLMQIEKESVPIVGSSGYLVGLGVMHQLHCLNHVREYAFPDYYARETGPDKEVHVYHCIDNLRRIIMCHADITPRTYEWTERSQYPAMKPKSERECRRWDPLYTFAKNNAPSKTHSAILENPTLGVLEPTHLNATQAQ